MSKFIQCHTISSCLIRSGSILPLDWYAFWCASRPVAVGLTYTKLDSNQSEARVADMKGLWSTCRVLVNDLAIVWPRRDSTVNYCKQKRKLTPHSQVKDQLVLTLAHWWFSRPISVLLTISHLVSYQLEAFLADMACCSSRLESGVFYKTIVKPKPGAQSHSCCKRHKNNYYLSIHALILMNNLRLQTGGLRDQCACLYNLL